MVTVVISQMFFLENHVLLRQQNGSAKIVYSTM